MENVEYTFLRQKEATLKFLLFERPFIITMLSLFLFTLSGNGYGSFIPCLGIILLIYFYKDSLIRLEKIESIKTYVKLTFEDKGRYIGWESFRIKYEKFLENNEQDKVVKTEDIVKVYKQYRKQKQFYTLNALLLLISSVLSYLAVFIQMIYFNDITSHFVETEADFITVFPLIGMIVTIITFVIFLNKVPTESNNYEMLYPIYNSRLNTERVLNDDKEGQ